MGSSDLTLPSRPSPWCSVVIPTLNEAARLPACLDRLTGAVAPGELEIIVVDGGSTDRTVDLARRSGCRVLAGTRGRARQLNAGAAAARGDILWFLHADTLPPRSWPHWLRVAAASRLPASFCLRFDRQLDSRWLRLFARGSRWNLAAFRFGDQSLIVSPVLFRGVGGYREELPLLEGHDLARRLRRAARGFLLLPVSVTTSARRYQTHGVVYTQCVYVLIFCLHYCGLAPAVLAALYRQAFTDRSLQCT